MPVPPHKHWYPRKPRSVTPTSSEPILKARDGSRIEPGAGRGLPVVNGSTCGFGLCPVSIRLGLVAARQHAPQDPEREDAHAGASCSEGSSEDSELPEMRKVATAVDRPPRDKASHRGQQHKPDREQAQRYAAHAGHLAMGVCRSPLRTEPARWGARPSLCRRRSGPDELGAEPTRSIGIWQRLGDQRLDVEV